jgi:putative redox protein
VTLKALAGFKQKLHLTNIIASAQAINKGDTYTTSLLSGKHKLVSDEPIHANGHDLGPAPGDYLCMSLASCTAITLRMYAQRKGWKVEEINIVVSLVKGTEMASGNNTFYCEVGWKGELTGEQEKRMLEIAKACPIHRLLTKPSDVLTISSEKPAGHSQP